MTYYRRIGVLFRFGAPSSLIVFLVSVCICTLGSYTSRRNAAGRRRHRGATHSSTHISTLSASRTARVSPRTRAIILLLSIQLGAHRCVSTTSLPAIVERLSLGPGPNDDRNLHLADRAHSENGASRARTTLAFLIFEHELRDRYYSISMNMESFSFLHFFLL